MKCKCGLWCKLEESYGNKWSFCSTKLIFGQNFVHTENNSLLYLTACSCRWTFVKRFVVKIFILTMMFLGHYWHCTQDRYGRGKITIQDFEKNFDDEAVVAFFESMEISAMDAWTLFLTLDVDGDHTVGRKLEKCWNFEIWGSQEFAVDILERDRKRKCISAIYIYIHHKNIVWIKLLHVVALSYCDFVWFCTERVVIHVTYIFSRPTTLAAGGVDEFVERCHLVAHIFLGRDGGIADTVCWGKLGSLSQWDYQRLKSCLIFCGNRYLRLSSI